MSSASRSIFESINARALTPTQVASRFVSSSHYVELCKRKHTIVLGPRGSGKTTLLKMLQPAAIASWKHPEANALANAVDFTGIFVATDISWSEQLNLLGREQLDPDSSALLALSCFTTHSLKAVITAFQQRVASSDRMARDSDIRLDPRREADIVSEIARSWYVDSIAPSFFSLRQAMTRRLVKIRELSSREISQGSEGRAQRLAAEAYLHLPFLQAAAHAIEVFEDSLNLSAGKWAYAFDELELAPEAIQRELVQSIRSTDERFLFKLALNPFTPHTDLLQQAFAPAAGQDFEQISLWYAEKRIAQQFCEGLWRELTREIELPELSPDEVLGPSFFESSPEDVLEKRGAYAPGSRWVRRFRDLASKDRSFRDYIRRRSIDLQALHLMDDDQRAAEIRKIAPIVALRDFYNRDQESRDELPATRSRKSATLYTGADSVFALTEGNPRIFLGLAGALLGNAKTRPRMVVPPRIQAVLLLAAAEKFLATLRTIPTQIIGANESTMGVVDLLRKIGHFFHDDAAKGEFKAAPVGTFIVDSWTPDSIINTLSQALNAGAIIYVPDDEGAIILTSLRGKKFRLSYLLAPVYGFPIRLGPHIALSRILKIREPQPKPIREPQPKREDTLRFGFSEEPK